MEQLNEIDILPTIDNADWHRTVTGCKEGSLEGLGKKLKRLESNMANLDERNQYILSAYLKEARQYPRLSREEERELSDQLKKGGELAEVAHHKLVVSNLRLVVRLAMSYIHAQVPLLDLIQEGNMGLMEGAWRYDSERGKFSAFIRWHILRRIYLVLKTSTTTDMGVSLINQVIEMQEARLTLLDELLRAPTDQEVADKMGISLERLWLLQIAAMEPIRLDTPLAPGSKKTVANTIPTEESSGDKELAAKEIKEMVVKHVADLPDQKRRVMELRFGFDEEPLSQKQVGERLGVKHQRISQIEIEVLTKLRKVVLAKLSRGIWWEAEKEKD